MQEERQEEQTAQAEEATEKEKGTVKFTPFQQRILGFIAAQTAKGGQVSCSKKAIAEQVHCDMKTVDRAIARLRKEGVIEVEERYAENGGQLANAYRTVR